MSKTEEKTAVAAKPSNKEIALKHISQILEKYKIVKLPVMIQNVVKATFGDLSKEEERADKAFTLVASLIEGLIDEDAVTAFTFAKQTSDGEKPVLLKEIILVANGFNLVGFQPLNLDSVVGHAPEEADDDDVFNDTDDVEVTDINTLIEAHAAGYAIITMDRTGETFSRQVVLRSDSTAALGKHLELAANEKNPELFALIPVDLQISTLAGRPVNVEDTPEDETESAA